ncbi:hypothetical protein [Streptomyces sp. NPDC053427]|uniref:hypothetical protein n=1 Tax=Streptomyces sp. NPDC053427 TaxID=3365701 RepID=UPI0037D44AE7
MDSSRYMFGVSRTSSMAAIQFSPPSWLTTSGTVGYRPASAARVLRSSAVVGANPCTTTGSRP